jgi:hypothetical protein
METFERQMGPGLPQIGGHPHGARLWQSRAAGCDILADAFDYNDRAGRAQGRVLDFLSITPCSNDPEIPSARMPPKQARFMGVVSLRMTKADVLQEMRRKLPPPQVIQNSLVWEAAGFFRVSRRNNIVFQTWRAELRFEGDRLKEIQITCSRK